MIKRDADRILAIERQVGDGKVVDPADITWLCRRFRGLAMPHLDEYDFPEYLAVSASWRKDAIGLRLLRIPPIRAATVVAGSGRDVAVKIFSCTWTCDVVEMLGVIRPWIRAEKEEDLEFLKSCSLDLIAGGEAALRNTSVSPYLMGPDGLGVNAGFPLPLNLEKGWKLMELDEHYECALPTRRLGIGVGTGESVDVNLRSEHGWPGRAIRLECGLTAGHYTSRPAEESKLTGPIDLSGRN